VWYTIRRSGRGTPEDGEFGYIIAKKYAYFASGPSEDKVKALMSESEPLDSVCVDNNVEFL